MSNGSYLAVPDDTVFLTPREAYDVCQLLYHVIKECETRDVDDYPCKIDLDDLHRLVRRLDY